MYIEPGKRVRIWLAEHLNAQTQIELRFVGFTVTLKLIIKQF
jgi:hypothetical protein